MKDLPQGWVEVEIGSVASIVAGGTPNSKELKNFASPGCGVPWITPADLSGYKYQTVMNGARDLSQQGYDSCSATLVPEGAVLFSSRAPIGYVAIAKQPVCTSQGFKNFVLPKGFGSRFLYYQLKQLKAQAEALATGTTFKELSTSAVSSLKVRIAPTAEQSRIADKLDALFGRIDACRERLDGIPRVLSNIRKKILDAAMSGDLTDDWRDARPHLEKWENRELASACVSGRVITYGVIKLGEEVAEGVPCLRTSNVRWLQIDTSGLKRIDPGISENYARTVLEGGEVLVNVRGTLGGVAVSDESMKGWNVSREIAVVPCDRELFVPAFLAFWIAAPRTQQKLSGMEKGVAYTGINLEDLRTLPVQRPDLAEQSEIVKRLESLFGLVDAIEAKWSVARERVERLTPALLEMAFSGELVNQDPSDPPAKSLLPEFAAAKIKWQSQVKRKARERGTVMKASSDKSLVDIVEAMEQSEFTFDELRLQVGKDYESIKKELFAALTASQPRIEQYFDAQAKTMKLRRINV
ncbi:restriction endonuclease subunit S [Stenotrophomonas muris]|uniref:restriction endonuclease subunit S n=1 Tax=Stenotrophomonas muris TaxID=2963283 RepID=UPI0039C5AB08